MPERLTGIQGTQSAEPDLLGCPSTIAEAMITCLRAMGFEGFAGVNGGGIIHFTRNIPPAVDAESSNGYLTISEYVAGFVPLGAYVATGQMRATIVTSGAASELTLSGLADATYHNIPAVFIFGVNPKGTRASAPLQDVSENGTSIEAQIAAVAGEGSALSFDDMESIGTFPSILMRRLRASKPSVIMVNPEILGMTPTSAVLSDWAKTVDFAAITKNKLKSVHYAVSDSELQTVFPRIERADRVVVLVTEEASRYPEAAKMLTKLVEKTGWDVIWTVNGAAAVETTANSHMIGYIGFGGSPEANALFQRLGEPDTLISLGFEPGEYVLDTTSVTAGMTVHVTLIPEPYGAVNGEFTHRCSGQYKRITAGADAFLRKLNETYTGSNEGVGVDRSVSTTFTTDRGTPPRPNTANDRTATSGLVDLAFLIRRLDPLWRPTTHCFDDVCVMYRDRQAVLTHPSPNVKVFSPYQGSAMGGAFGYSVGAKLADPDNAVFCFSGDGCFRLYAGALAETKDLGLNLFLLDNSTLGIVSQGLRRIYEQPESAGSFTHSDVQTIDYEMMAQAQGWRTVRLDEDLTNLDSVMEFCYEKDTPSLLVHVPLSAIEEYGINPRLSRL